MAGISIGRLGRVHGLRGELILERCSLETRDLERIGSFTWRGRDSETQTLELAGARPVHQGVLVRFTGYDDRDRAMLLSRGELFVDQEQLPDPGPDFAYTFQLIGMEVHDEHGRNLGQLAQILDTGAHPVYVVEGERELLIPAHPGVLQYVDREARVITVVLPLGLEDL